MMQGEIDLFLGRFRPKYQSETSKISSKKDTFRWFLAGKKCLLK